MDHEIQYHKFENGGFVLHKITGDFKGRMPAGRLHPGGLTHANHH